MPRQQQQQQQVWGFEVKSLSMYSMHHARYCLATGNSLCCYPQQINRWVETAEAHAAAAVAAREAERSRARAEKQARDEGTLTTQTHIYIFKDIYVYIARIGQQSQHSLCVIVFNEQ